MRASGSIKSMTTGVSTLNSSQFKDRLYMKECLNMRNDQIDGLRRRASMDVVITNPDLVDHNLPVAPYNELSDNDVVKSFELDGTEYWLVIHNSDPSDPTPAYTRLQVLSATGDLLYTDTTTDNYLKTVQGNDSIRLLVRDKTLIIANTDVVITSDDLTYVQNESSMLIVRTQPRVFTTIIIGWLNSDGTRAALSYEIGSHVPGGVTDVTLVDTSVVTIAKDIAVQIAQLFIDNGLDAIMKVFTLGGTVSIVDKSSNTFVDLQIEDGTGGAIIAINESVDDIALLPKDAVPNTTLRVRRNAQDNRGEYFMRSVIRSTKETAVDATDAWTIFSEGRVTNGVDESGYSKAFGHELALGSAVGSLAVTGTGITEIGQVLSMLVVSDPDNDAAKGAMLQIRVQSPTSDVLPANAITYVELWDTTSTPNTRLVQAYMSLTESTPDSEFSPMPAGGNSVHTWEARLDNFALPVGRNISVYTADYLAGVAELAEVQWEEVAVHDEPFRLSTGTMPHALTKMPSGEFIYGNFNECPSIEGWSDREAGDDRTNPMPEFVGKTIKDIAMFQDRLCMLAGDTVSMSVTGQPWDFFRGTVTQLLATSPISLRGAATGASELTHLVTYDNDLLVCSPLGQFQFKGGVALTPETSALPKVAAYPTSVLAKPIQAGTAIFFATSYGDGVGGGLARYGRDPQVQALSVATMMSDHVIGLIKDDIQQVVAFPDKGIVVLRPQAPRNELFIVEFQPQVDILQTVVPTWSKWTLGTDDTVIKTLRTSGEYLSLAVLEDGTEGTLTILKMHMAQDRATKNLEGTDFGNIALDFKTKVTGVNTTIQVPNQYPLPEGGIEELFVVHGLGAPYPGDRVAFTYASVGDAATGHYLLTLEEDMEGGAIYYGHNFDSLVTLYDLDVRDASGIIQSQANLRVNNLWVGVTGHLRADIGVVRPDDSITYYEPQRWLGNLVGGMLTDMLNYKQQNFRVQVMQNAVNVVMTLRNDSHIAMSIHQVEWEGTYVNNKGRRF